MNIIEAIKIILNETPGDTPLFDEAVSILNTLSDGYNALEPNWNDAESWAQWYTIDNDGCYFWGDEPVFSSEHRGGWRNKTGYEKCVYYKDCPRAEMIWQLCKWRRPDVEP